MGDIHVPGSKAVLSHRAAAALWGLNPSFDEPFDVTTTVRTRRGVDGITLHRVHPMPPGERADLHGVPVTTLPRALLTSPPPPHGPNSSAPSGRLTPAASSGPGASSPSWSGARGGRELRL